MLVSTPSSQRETPKSILRASLAVRETLHYLWNCHEM